MNLFKDFTFHWWEFSLLKISMVSLGILAGSYFSNFFRTKTMTLFLIAVFVLPAIYLIFKTFKQAK